MLTSVRVFGEKNEFDPDEKEWKRVILSSYAHLRKKLQEMDYQYNQARAFLYNS